MILSIRSSPVRSETSNPWSDPPPTTQAYACPASRYSPAALPLAPRAVSALPSRCRSGAASEPIRAAALASSNHPHPLSTPSPSRRHRRLLAPPPSCYPSQPPRGQDLAARAHGQRITAAYGVSSCGRRARPAWILVPCAPRAVAAASRPRASMP